MSSSPAIVTPTPILEPTPVTQPTPIPEPTPVVTQPIAAATGVLQYPLSTKGNQIVDANGQPVQLAGVNWYGMNTNDYVPQGLWARDYKSMLSQIKGLGFNLIRVPFSYDSVYAGPERINDGINYWLGANEEFRGKRPIEVLDLIVQEAGRQGLMIVLENHNFQADTQPQLWYQDGYSEGMWIDMWKKLAQRYANQPNVIGADLKNEPNTTATWGNGDLATDWRLAAERAGNEVLSVNPKWLIIVEGVGEDPSDPNTSQKRYWWGQNLERAGQFPVRLNLPNRLVYSPHDYGPGNARTLRVEEFIPYLNDPTFPNNLEPRWDTAFGYLHDQNIAPIFMGEFGGPGPAYYDRDGLWQDKLIPYLDRKDMSWAYWAWNPQSYESGGGILGWDWQTVRTDRHDMLKPLIEEATPVPKLP
jgi:endoglucanase